MRFKNIIWKIVVQYSLFSSLSEFYRPDVRGDYPLTKLLAYNLTDYFDCFLLFSTFVDIVTLEAYYLRHEIFLIF